MLLFQQLQMESIQTLMPQVEATVMTLPKTYPWKLKFMFAIIQAKLKVRACELTIALTSIILQDT